MVLHSESLDLFDKKAVSILFRLDDCTRIEVDLGNSLESARYFSVLDRYRALGVGIPVVFLTNDLFPNPMTLRVLSYFNCSLVITCPIQKVDDAVRVLKSRAVDYRLSFTLGEHESRRDLISLVSRLEETKVPYTFALQSMKDKKYVEYVFPYQMRLLEETGSLHDESILDIVRESLVDRMFFHLPFYREYSVDLGSLSSAGFLENRVLQRDIRQLSTSKNRRLRRGCDDCIYQHVCSDDGSECLSDLYKRIYDYVDRHLLSLVTETKILDVDIYRYHIIDMRPEVRRYLLDRNVGVYIEDGRVRTRSMR